MKKKGILNSKLAGIIAAMGHTDKLVVCDAGLPIPHNAMVVDLALTKNIPRFLDTLVTILDELEVERAILANEIKTVNHGLYDKIKTLLPKIEIQIVDHEEFKQITGSSNNMVFVRTGESTPYANIILISGVCFD